MCEKVPGFKEKLLDQLKRSPRIQSLQDAFHIYLQNPLDELEEKPRLIVIDALDESASDGKSDMVKMVANVFPELPASLKVLVTSRPGISLETLSHVEKIEIATEHAQQKLDIKQCLSDCLSSIAAIDTSSNSARAHHSNDSLVKAIAAKFQGSFLYAFHLQQELRKRRNLNSMSIREIMSILPRGMSSVYEDYFHCLEIELEAVMKRKPDLANILELLVAAYRPAVPLTFLCSSSWFGSRLSRNETNH